MECKGCGCSMVSSVLAIASLVAIVVNLWPAAEMFIVDTNIWWFVLAFVVFGLLSKKLHSGGCICRTESKAPVSKVAPAQKKAKKKR